MIETLLFTSLFIFGVWLSTAEGMIGDKLRWEFISLWPNLAKPVVDCPTCMASVYGSLAYWGQYLINDNTTDLLTFIGWPIFVVCLAGLNGIILKLAKWS
jgi:hypothetical protein